MEDQMALLVADLFQAAGMSRKLGEEIAKEVGQSQARWQLLSVVSDGPRTVPQAARRLGVTRQAVQRVAGELVDDGLLVASANPDHRTSVLFELTETGQEALTAMNSAAGRVHRELLETIPMEEVVLLREGLHHLMNVLEAR